MRQRQRQFFVVIVLTWMTAGTGCAQATSEELMEMARAAVAGGEARTAEIHLRNLLREEPDNAVARSFLGQVLLDQGDAAAAEAALRRALELGAQPDSVQIPLLQALIAQGRFGDALEQIEDGPQLIAEDRITVLRLAGAAHRGLNRPEEAERAYRSALELDADSSAVRTDLAALMLASGRADDARRWIVDVLTDDPTYSPALVLRGTLEFIGRRLDDAETTFLEVIEREGTQGESYLPAMAPLIEVLIATGDIQAAALRAEQLISSYPNHPIAMVLKSEVEVRQGDLDPAKRRLEALVANASDYAPANRILGIINARQGQTRQAQMYLQSALTQAPEDRRALLQLAKLHLDQGDRTTAQQVLKRSLAANQELSEAMLLALAARVGLQLGERELAAQFLELGVSASSGDPQDMMALAAIYSESGQMDRAQALLESSESEADTAWVATFGLALTQLQERDFETADETAQRLAVMRPESPMPLNLRGMIAVSRQDLQAASEHFSAALAVDPRHVPAILNRANLLLVQGRRDEAVQDFRSALEIQPDNALALLTLARLAIAERDLDEARDLVERAPDSVPRMQLQGALALLEGRFGEAADILREVFDRQPSSEHALQAFSAAQRASRPQPDAVLRAWLAQNPNDAPVNFALGSLALQAGNQDEAIARFETVVAANPEQAEALNNLAWLYGEKGDSRAITTAERAHSVAPDNPAIADTLGWLRVRNGDAEGGLPLLEQSHTMIPGNAEIHFHWAVALAETGADDRAVTALRELLSTHSDFPQRTDAERLLRELE